MSNEKIRRWIYRAVAFLILVGIGWFLLLRESRNTKQTLNEMYQAHQQAFEDCASYLLEKDANVDITGLPTIDNKYDIPYEDTKAYTRFMDGLYEVMETDIKEIAAANGCVRFVTYKSGGFLVQTKGAIACGDAPAFLSSTPRDVLNDSGWYYYIIKEE